MTDRHDDDHDFLPAATAATAATAAVLAGDGPRDAGREAEVAHGLVLVGRAQDLIASAAFCLREATRLGLVGSARAAMEVGVESLRRAVGDEVAGESAMRVARAGGRGTMEPDRGEVRATR